MAENNEHEDQKPPLNLLKSMFDRWQQTAPPPRDYKDDTEPHPAIMADQKPNTASWNPEVARQMAEDLARREDELASLLAETPGAFDIGNILQQKVFIEHSEFANSISSYEEPIAKFGIGDGGVVFVEHLKEYPSEFYAKLGIKTRYRLDIGLHSDPNTMQQMERIAEQDPKVRHYPQTVYLVGPNALGEYVFGKVCGIHRSIPDSRPDVGSPGILKKYVVSEFMPGDVEIMGAAIKLLTDKLRPPTEEQPPNA